MPETLDYRPMLAADLAQVIAIEQQAFTHPWSRALYQDAMQRYQCWVAERQGVHLGHAVMHYVMDEAHLLNIVIAVQQQGCGYGRQLLDFVLQQARQRGCQECFLELRASNATAYRLYEHAGFNETGRRRDYYPTATGSEDAILMVYSF